MKIFERRPGAEATTYAQAQALVDDGLDLGLVLDLFRADAAWLEPLLTASTTVTIAAEVSQPSYFFDASLKRKFVAAGARQGRQLRRTPVLEVASTGNRIRTAMASTALVAAAAAIGVAAFAFIRADDGNSTDPNRGTLTVSRLDTHLQQSQAHVSEILARAATTGQVSETDLAVIESDTKVLAAYAQEAPLDTSQKERAQAFVEKAVKVINDAQARPELEPKAKTTLEIVATAAAAAGLEGVTGIATPAPSPTPTRSSTATATASVTPSTTPASSATPEATHSASASATASPAATASSTATPVQTPAPTPTAENNR